MRKLNETKPGQWYIHRKPNASDVQKVELNDIPIDLDLIKKEVIQAQVLHKFTEKDAKGWTSIPLRSAKGETGKVGNAATPSSDERIYKDTYVMQSTPCIKQTIELISEKLLGDILKVRLMKLQAQSKIPMHIDKFDGVKQVTRYHMPIITNPNVIMIVNNKNYYLEPGKIYTIDVSQAHAVENNSDEDRIHLVFDLSQRTNPKGTKRMNPKGTKATNLQILVVK